MTSKKTEWCGVGMVVCLERDADLHMAQPMPLPLTVSCFSKIQIDFTFLLPVQLGSPREMAISGTVCVVPYTNRQLLAAALWVRMRPRYSP